MIGNSELQERMAEQMEFALSQTPEALAAENAKLLELCVQMVETIECYSGTKKCVLFSECAAGGHEPCLYEQKLRDLGIEVPR